MSNDGGGDPGEMDLERLSRYLRALASPIRLRILWSLQSPHRQSDVRAQATGEWAGLQAERPLTRSGILRHLAQLEELGFVSRLGADDGRYVVNQQMMVALVEELGRLARLRPTVPPDVEETLQVAPPAPRAIAAGEAPRLALVGGPRDGDVFSLHGRGPWTLGRGAEASLRLDYDPHLSALHATLARGAGGGFTLESARGAKNPCFVDGALVPPGAPVPLPPGSVIRAGSSRLVLQLP